MIFSRNEWERTVFGAVKIEESTAGTIFQRFTESQRTTYLDDPDFYRKTFADSCIRIEFETDAEAVQFNWLAEKGSSRKFCYFDCYVNGVLLLHKGTEDIYQNGSGTLKLPLCKGCKNIRIYLPCLTKINIRDFELIDGRITGEVTKKEKWLCFGDSITQGYDALFPSLAYPNQLGDAFQAEVFNKAIGGDVFNPTLLQEPDDFLPDVITVAYGTNDWNKCRKEVIFENSEKFYNRLVELYPQSRIIALLPIWRKDCERETSAGSFEGIRQMLCDIGKSIRQITVIQPEIPHHESIFSDSYLHPNDLGFTFMAKNIEFQLRSMLLK